MFATTDDINRCKHIVQNILRDKGISRDDSSVDEIVKKVLAITYGTGGDYTDESLEDYARSYLEDIF